MDCSPVKDPHDAHPIADTWRPVLAAIVRAIARGEHRLDDVQAHIPDDLRASIRANVEDYGATLVELPDQTWATSVAQWMGSHWELLVDLWTQEEGHSDLVLALRVFEDDGGYRFVVDGVHVP